VPPIVGLIALIIAADARRTASFEAPHDVTTLRGEAGAIVAFDVVQRNARMRSAITSLACSPRLGRLSAFCTHSEEMQSTRILATNSQPNHYANTIVEVHPLHRCGWTHEQPTKRLRLINHS
jgi:hypothetical protein